MALTLPIGPAAIAIAGCACIALGALAYAQHVRLESADLAQQEMAKDVTALREQLAAEQSARAEEQRRVTKQKEIANDAQRQLEHTADERDSAVAAAGRLYDRLDAAGRAAATTCYPAAAATSAPAAGTDMVSADVYRQLLGAARRVVDRGADLANEADKRRIRGLTTEGSYDALTPAP